MKAKTITKTQSISGSGSPLLWRWVGGEVLSAKTIIYISLLVVLITSCKKKEADKPDMEKGTVTDVCGNTYTTVKIGNQWWMAEDLRTTKYRDSSFISLLVSDTAWSHRTTGAYCNNSNSQNIVLGTFYNWYAITDPRGIAPAGWHIPGDEEWKVLEESLGMSIGEANGTGWRGTHEGEKMKVIRGTTNGWSDYGNVWNTNESGFSALAGGCRMFDGTSGNPGQYATAFWWSSSAKENQVWYRYLDYKNANVFRYYGSKNYGFSVRCVKD